MVTATRETEENGCLTTSRDFVQMGVETVFLDPCVDPRVQWVEKLEKRESLERV